MLFFCYFCVIFSYFCVVCVLFWGYLFLILVLFVHYSVLFSASIGVIHGDDDDNSDNDDTIKN